jgi:hypothetical protein
VDVRKHVRKWELIGIALIMGVGSALHFAFKWSGELAPIGVFAAVNESVFEHLKLAYWPAMLYAAIEYRFINKFTNNFLIAKTAGIYVAPAAILVLFYSYTAITGAENLIADIAIFGVAIALGQLVSYRILLRPRLSHRIYIAAFVGLISLGIIYTLFTYFPPQSPVFMDSNTGTYGIP